MNAKRHKLRLSDPNPLERFPLAIVACMQCKYIGLCVCISLRAFPNSHQLFSSAWEGMPPTYELSWDSRSTHGRVISKILKEGFVTSCLSVRH